MNVSPTSPTSRSVWIDTVRPALLVGCVTFIAYLPSLSGHFIWNDSDYVTAPALRSLAGLGRLWTDFGAAQQYYPLLHSAFWLEHRLWGDHPLPYHVVTLLQHAGAAVLFALVMRRLWRDERNGSPRYPGAEWLAALVFALHPVHVESVAWITEQKNTLSLLFYLAAALAYLHFDDTRRTRSYVAAFALFVASLLCKTVTATLPAALLVVLWWKRGRLQQRRDVLPLVPWLAVGASMGLLASWVEKTYLGAQGADFQLSYAERLLVAGRAVWFYAVHLFVPLNLNFVYARWVPDPTSGWQWLLPTAVVGLAVALWTIRARTRGLLAAFLFFVGSLFPVLGFVNLFGARYSWVWDHWQYLPNLGLIALVAVALVLGWQRVKLRIHLPGVVPVAILAAALASLSWAHCGMFHDDETLFRQTLERNPDCWMAHANLGLIWSHLPGRANDAIAEYEEALRLQPDFPEARNDLGVAWSQMPGKLNDAIAQFAEALRLHPRYVTAYNNLGLALAKIPDRQNEAIAQFEEALKLAPNSADTHNNLGHVLSRLPARQNEAIAQFQEALRLDPEFADAHNNLGVAYAKNGRLSEAVAQFEEGVRLAPNSADAHYNLGRAYSETNTHLSEAAVQFREAVRLQPASIPAWHYLGVTLLRLGHRTEAAAAFREELRLAPDSSLAREALSAALGSGDGL